MQNHKKHNDRLQLLTILLDDLNRKYNIVSTPTKNDSEAEKTTIGKHSVSKNITNSTSERQV